MARIINRCLSLLICGSYVFFGGYLPNHNIGTAAKVLLPFLLPMACIWFSETMSQYTGSFWAYGSPRINETSSAGCILILGWLLLLIPMIIAVIVAA